MKILNYKDNCLLEGTELPAAISDLCAPQLHMGPVMAIYFTDGPPMTDWTDPWQWKARLDNLAEAPGRMRMLHVIGNKPEEKDKDINLAMDTLVRRAKEFRLKLEVDETGPVNYALLNYLECMPNLRFWFQTKHYLYGGNEGIDGQMKLSEVIGPEVGGVNHFEGELTWAARRHPERIANPFGMGADDYSVSQQGGAKQPHLGTIEWELPFTIRAEIVEYAQSWKGMFLEQGELGVEIQELGEAYIDYSLNEEGELLVTATAPSDRNKYSINSDGYLIWTE